jgi:putative GTP pyrophosphokinase
MEKKELLQTSESDETLKVWEEKLDVIRTFIENRPQYEQLCGEVAYILAKRMQTANIEYSAITNRAKSLKSFIEKLFRKSYSDPIKDITDFAGVRLVFLYKSDQEAIENIIESEFSIKEKSDKIEERDADRFGYGALHYIVNIGKKSSGARYDDLKDLACEIQVRTVLQDAWAVIYHHLSYKQESDVPKVLIRKLNSVAGLFETADDQFDSIRIAREKYKTSIKPKRNDEDRFLKQEINLDTFAEFLRWKFPSLSVKSFDDIPGTLSTFSLYGFKTLADLEHLLDRTNKELDAVALDVPPTSGTQILRRALALSNEDFRNKTVWKPKIGLLLNKHMIS